MSFPPEIILKRVRNELKQCMEYQGRTVLPVLGDTLPIEIEFTMENVPAYESRDKIVTTHKFSIFITGDYGMKKPEVRWRTHIFHPNIMDPDDGGLVCIKMLNEWDYGTTLLSFLKGIEVLLTTPNPEGPFGTDSCMDAAEFFSGNVSKFEFQIKR